MCQHSHNLVLPKASSKIYKDECTLCFESQDSPSGVDVCLTCYNGSCPSDHSELHQRKTNHSVYLNITRKLIKVLIINQKPTAEPTKLAIAPQEDEYEYFTKIKCLACGIDSLNKEEDNVNLDLKQLREVVEIVLNSASAKKKEEMRAWEEETVTKCFHTDNLEQHKQTLAANGLAHCNACDLKDNLWLCLTCGSLGCGRKQYGGLGGNGHAMMHFESTHHPIAVKMGSITPEGTADLFCYEHGTEIVNPNLGSHLANFGINILSQEKTEKSIAEMQLEQNLKFEFSMVTEDGKEMQPVYGPGLTGMRNLGNSCYLSSVMQVLASLSSIQRVYYEEHLIHLEQCFENPVECFRCQMGKLTLGLLSGKYSHPSNDAGSVNGIAPSMFKAIIGKDHPEFSTMRQQDAQEFLQHVLDTIKKKEMAYGVDPSSGFTFTMENRLQCMQCQRVHYSKDKTSSIILRVPAHKSGEDEKGVALYHPVNFEDMVNSHFSADTRDYQCPVENALVFATVTQRFQTFPDILVFTAARFVLGSNWVMEKLNVKINVPLKLSLGNYRGTGLQPGEEEFPQEAKLPDFNEADLNQLLQMGFPEVRCKRALIKTGHNGAETAMNWLFEHMEDPDIDAPLEAESAPGPDLGPLIDMGFTAKHARKALEATGNDMERAVDWLFSHPDTDEGQEMVVETDNGPADYELYAMISHKGTSAHCGHYVAYIKKENRWILFNDEKVVEVPDITSATTEAYVYFYRRIKD